MVALLYGVGEVLLGGVLGIHGPQCRVHPACGEHGVGVLARALADDHDLRAGLVRGDGGSQTGGPGPDD